MMLLCLFSTAMADNWMLEEENKVKNSRIRINDHNIGPNCLEVRGTYYKDQHCTEKDLDLTSEFRDIYTETTI